MTKTHNNSILAQNIDIGPHQYSTVLPFLLPSALHKADQNTKAPPICLSKAPSIL